MTGEARYWLYRLALSTGLRSNELRNLTVSSFDLNGSDPTVTVSAASAKNRKSATLPLRPDTATGLREFLRNKLPTANVFKMPRRQDVATMLRDDLADAGIPFADDSGRVCDFHSLRTTFASLLLHSGVDIRTARDLMRHSTIALTADVYACTFRASEREAVARLPDLATGPHIETARRTGTDNSVLASCLALDRTDPGNSVHDGARSKGSLARRENPPSDGKSRDSRPKQGPKDTSRTASRKPHRRVSTPRPTMATTTDDVPV